MFHLSAGASLELEKELPSAKEAFTSMQKKKNNQKAELLNGLKDNICAAERHLEMF